MAYSPCMATYPLSRATEPLVAEVDIDPVTEAALRPFDLDPSKPTAFYPFAMPDGLPDDFGIGVIVGASGSGKSLLLSHFGRSAPVYWTPRGTVVSHFGSAEDAAERLYAVGLNSVPVWRLPYGVLSNGQRFRADLARVLRAGAVVDEYSSVVDRRVAVAASRSLSAYVARTGLRRLVLATCHRDVLEWLRPDWVIDTDAGTLTVGEAAEARHWYAEHVIGEPEGRLVLA